MKEWSEAYSEKFGEMTRKGMGKRASKTRWRQTVVMSSGLFVEDYFETEFFGIDGQFIDAC